MELFCPYPAFSLYLGQPVPQRDIASRPSLDQLAVFGHFRVLFMVILSIAIHIVFSIIPYSVYIMYFKETGTPYDITSRPSLDLLDAAPVCHAALLG